MEIGSCLVVYKKSAYELYSSSPEKKTRAYAETDAAVRKSHDMQTESLIKVLRELDSRGIKHEDVYRGDLEEVGEHDLIIVIGGDGTVLNLAHYVRDIPIPILGVNSDPSSSVGYYSHCNAEGFSQAIKDIETISCNELNRLEVAINGQRIPEYVLNDVLVAHINPAAYIRYKLQIDGRNVVDQNDNPRIRSSGLLVSTAGGSTAFMFQEGGTPLSLESKLMQYFERSVRNATRGYASEEIKVESLTREGKLFVDGQHLTYDFTLGDCVTIKQGTPLTIIGDLEGKRKRFMKEVVPRKFEGE